MTQAVSQYVWPCRVSYHSSGGVCWNTVTPSAVFCKIWTTVVYARSSLWNGFQGPWDGIRNELYLTLESCKDSIGSNQTVTGMLSTVLCVIRCWSSVAPTNPRWDSWQSARPPQAGSHSLINISRNIIKYLYSHSLLQPKYFSCPVSYTLSPGLHKVAHPHNKPHLVMHFWSVTKCISCRIRYQSVVRVEVSEFSDRTKHA